jgi:hypothetical protein
MKTTILSKTIVLVTILFTFFISPDIAKSQLPCTGYTIINNLTGASCVITISYKYVCTSPPSTCSSQAGVVINGAGGSITLPSCTCGANTCDLKVILTDVNGTTISPPVTVDAANPTGTFTVPPSSCVGTGSVTLGVSGTVTVY